MDAPPPLPPPFDPSGAHTNASPVYQDIADISVRNTMRKDEEINKTYQENKAVDEVTTKQIGEKTDLKEEVY